MLDDYKKLERRIKLLEKENEYYKNKESKQFDLLFNQLPIAVYYYNKDGILTDCNKKFLEIIGTTREKVLGLDTINNISNEGVKQATIDSLKSGDGMYLGYYESVTGDVEIYAKGTFSAIRNNLNEITGGICIIEDLTEQHKKEKEISDANYEYKTINDIYVEQNKELEENQNKLQQINNELVEKNTLIKAESDKNKILINKMTVLEDNYKTIFDNSPNPMIVHQNGIILFINDAAFNFFEGNNKKKIVGLSIKQFIHEDSIQKAKVNIEKVLKGKVGELTEEKYITENGNIRLALVKSGPAVFNNKVAVLASFIDITEYKKNEERLNVIIKGVEASPASIVVTDTNGDIQYVNSKFCEVTGYTEEEALGINPRVLSSGTYKPEFYEQMWKVITSGKSWKAEMLNKKKNGEFFWEYVIISSIVNDKGEVTNYIAIKEDITRRKEIESKLIKNEKYFKTLFETAPDGIFEIDKNGTITNCNREFANSVNSVKADIIGISASNFNTNKKTFAQLFNKLKSEGSIESELIQQNTDGSTSVVWRKVTAIYDKGDKFTGALVYNRDISNIKETEQLLIDAKNKAEESDQLKSAFLSNMSHEIRTPLNAIIGFSKLVSKEGIRINEKKKFSNYININSKLLLTLINDIIDISKIEANQLNINKKEFVLNNLFIELEILFNSQLKESGKNLNLLLKIPKQIVNIKTDELRLKQILINLISNAIKFTEQGSIVFGFNLKENNINIFVKDTGIGIPDNKIALIFNRFVRIHNIEYKQKGTGLGLAIVKSLISLLDGKISVKSKSGIGTEFKILLPRSIIVKESNSFKIPTEINAKSIDWSGKTILIAEDDEFNFIVLRELLKEFRVNIIRAKDGREAIDLYIQNEKYINLVLMDIQMPRIDGYQATQEILKINDSAKIVAQTAFAMSDEKFDSIDAGCIDFITKPIDTEQLELLLSNYL